MAFGQSMRALAQATPDAAEVAVEGARLAVESLLAHPATLKCVIGARPRQRWAEIGLIRLIPPAAGALAQRGTCATLR